MQDVGSLISLSLSLSFLGREGRSLRMGLNRIVGQCVRQWWFCVPFIMAKS